MVWDAAKCLFGCCPFPVTGTESDCVIWTVTHDGWKIHQGPCDRALLYKSVAKTLLRNNTTVTPRTSALTCALALSYDAEYGKKSSEPEPNGSVKSFCFCSSVGLGATGTGPQK